MSRRLSRSSSIQQYLHVEKPSAFILYDEHSEKLCAALCGRLISRGFDIVVISMSSRQSSLHEHLQSAHPNKSVVAFNIDIEKPEASMQSLSDAARSSNVTLCISAINCGLLSVGSRSDEAPTSTYPSVELFVDFQKLVLPPLARNAPSALVILADTLSPRFADQAQLLRSFTSGLSNASHSFGHDEVHVTLMEYLSPSTGNSILSPSTEVLADSILQAVGRSSTNIIPYWSHELFAWFIWPILLIFPSRFLRRGASWPLFFTVVILILSYRALS